MEAAEGNPLFVEQMVAMLIDDGLAPTPEGDGWVVTGDLSNLTVPPTIAGLLQARLDRLVARGAAESSNAAPSRAASSIGEASRNCRAISARARSAGT